MKKTITIESVEKTELFGNEGIVMECALEGSETAEVVMDFCDALDLLDFLKKHEEKLWAMWGDGVDKWLSRPKDE